MREELKKLLAKSYSPYSKYPVAAIVVTNDEYMFKGVNVENASYGATICAERNAINSAITKGYRKGDFKALYVMVDGDDVAFPCFICRQTLAEFFTGDELLVISNDTRSKTYKISEILTHPFSSEDLK